MKRRKWSSEQKLKIVLEGLSGQIEISKLCNKYQISQPLYYHWREQLLHFGHHMGFIFIIIVGLVIYFIVSKKKSNKYVGEFKETPSDIIKGRYAKGEITEEEFEKMKKNLKS